MPPQLSDDEIVDLLYYSRAGEDKDLSDSLAQIADRKKGSHAEILTAARDESKSTCLHMATGNGHLITVKFLLEQFSDRPREEQQSFLDAQNEYGNTGLHWAALGGHLEVVKLLMASGASPAIANDSSHVPLDLALRNERAAVVEFFLSQSANLEATNGSQLSDAMADASLEDGQEEPATSQPTS